jgi:hypothetical protein
MCRISRFSLTFRYRNAHRSHLGSPPTQSATSGGVALKKRVASVVAVAAIGVVGLVGGASAHPATSHNVAQASKSCGNGDVSANTPGGVKCLGPGEYCSHKPGYAAAYKKAGFVCDREGRLEER